MRDVEFRCLLSLYMVSDPWPLNKTSSDVIENMLDEEAKARGHDGWLAAYHSFNPKGDADGHDTPRENEAPEEEGTAQEEGGGGG